VIIDQTIPEKLSIASYSTRELFSAAHRFLEEFSAHFQRAIKQQQAAINANETADFTIVCWAGNARIQLKTLLECMQRINFKNQGMNMAVERYICRHTPDYAALPPSQQLQTMQQVIQEFAGEMFGVANAQNVEDILAGGFAVLQVLSSETGQPCVVKHSSSTRSTTGQYSSAHWLRLCNPSACCLHVPCRAVWQLFLHALVGLHAHGAAGH
jgi:hypothetical protein